MPVEDLPSRAGKTPKYRPHSRAGTHPQKLGRRKAREFQLDLRPEPPPTTLQQSLLGCRSGALLVTITRPHDFMRFLNSNPVYVDPT